MKDGYFNILFIQKIPNSKENGHILFKGDFLLDVILVDLLVFEVGDHVLHLFGVNIDVIYILIEALKNTKVVRISSGIPVIVPDRMAFPINYVVVYGIFPMVPVSYSPTVFKVYNLFTSFSTFWAY